MSEGAAGGIFPIKTVSESNVRTHWAKRAARAKAQRLAAALALRDTLTSFREGLGHREPGTSAEPSWSVLVTLVRLAPRMLDDDNLRGALKSVRDGVADALGVDDRDPRVEWKYRQMRGRPKYYGVSIGIYRMDSMPAF